jgi:hypothetical protein
MGLIVFMIVVSLGFQASVRGRIAHWEVSRDGMAAVRIGAGLIIVLWCMIMVAGRWIAYAPV